MNALITQIIRHEGRRNKMYPDSKGIMTIGVGHNLEDRPISDKAVEVILEDDLKDCSMDLFTHIPWTNTLDEVRRDVLINMCFNMGISRLMGFEKMLAAARNGNFQLAALEMLDSDWADQVGYNRSHELSMQMRTGSYA